MDDRAARVSALANAAIYDAEGTRRYIDQAPHLKHMALRKLYGRLVLRVYDTAARGGVVPRVLDLGAGEGSATLPFLQLGANVTAVDLSDSQLAVLRSRCARYADRLELRCQEALAAIQTLHASGGRYDVVVANSFLHHIPDYLALVRQAAGLLDAHGQFFSFQDPLRYDSLASSTRLFSVAAFVSWRIFRPDVIGGIRRRLRRARGVYLPDCPQDNAEYHFVRNGVDQDAIARLFDQLGFDCQIIRYFSTLSRLCQPVGAALGVHNTFAVLASRRSA